MFDLIKCVSLTCTQEYLQGVKLLDTVLRNLGHETTMRDDVSHVHTYASTVIEYCGLCLKQSPVRNVRIVCIYVRTCVRMYTCLHLYVCMYVCTYVHMCVFYVSVFCMHTYVHVRI